MEEKNTKKEVYDDEIDLYELFLVIKKRFNMVVIFCLSGLLISLVYVFVATPIYKSEVVIKIPNINNNTNIITFYESKDIIEKFYKKIKEKNYEDIKKKGLNLSAFKNLVKLDINRPKDATGHIIVLSIETKNPNDIVIIANDIIKYMNANEFVKKLLALKQNEINESIKEIENNLNEAIRIKDYYFNKIKNNQNVNLNFNPAEINTTIITLTNQLYNLKLQRDLVDGYKLTSDIYIPKYPYKPKKILIVTISVITSFILAIFVIFFMEFMDNIKKKK